MPDVADFPKLSDSLARAPGQTSLVLLDGLDQRPEPSATCVWSIQETDTTTASVVKHLKAPTTCYTPE